MPLASSKGGLADFKIKNDVDASQFLKLLDLQLTKWMQTNDIRIPFIHRIFYNKALYFSSKAIGREVGTSWYLYGPYVWLFPENEDQLLATDVINSGMEINLNVVDEEPIQRALDWLGHAYFKDSRTPETIYAFLEKVYSTTCESYSKEFYLAKNSVGKMVRSYYQSDLDLIEIIPALKQFERAMYGRDFSNRVRFADSNNVIFSRFFTALYSSADSRDKKLQHDFIETLNHGVNRLVCKNNSLITAKSYSPEAVEFHRKNIKKEIRHIAESLPNDVQSLEYRTFHVEPRQLKLIWAKT